MQLSEDGQPVYGERDIPDLEAIARLGVPFWLAGSFGSPEALVDALESGAQGIQVGTPFAFCEESDLTPEIKRAVLEASRCGRVRVFTDPLASPTGFPFKVVQLDDTISDAPMYGDRQRICDLAHLRQAYPREDGELGYRCPAEPVDEYVKKGGKPEDTVGRKCLCNALLANIGLGQVRGGDNRELPLVTSGQEVVNVACFLPANAESYTASEVIERLLGGQPATRAPVGVGVGRLESRV
jgi:nitronate monooxygenase